VSPTNAASLQPSQHLVDPHLLAKLNIPRLVPRRPAQPADDLQPSDLEKKVFGPRRFYSMTLNMPNLNSAGGSWVVHFAELKEDNAEGELVPPIATQKVDPAYPAELMRTRVEGTVTLYAIIHSDGSVGDVRVLAGNDERLSRFASSALARWQFRPATKNGSAVALEAVVTIPFRAVVKP
jgi:TonB family protein